MRVLLTGAGGVLGTQLLYAFGCSRPDVEVIAPDRRVLDLRDGEATARFVRDTRPDAIVHAAAVVGGIAAKLAHPSKYLLENAALDASVFRAAIGGEVPELLYISSSVIYPVLEHRAIAESDLFTGPLEEANESYGLAKLAGARLCEFVSREFEWSYRAAVLCNLYGPGDNVHEETGHVVSSALAKVIRAVEQSSASVTVWGDGSARRELAYAPEVAEWLVSQAGSLDRWPVLLNVGSGMEYTITEIYEAAMSAASYRGAIAYDIERPAGARRRLLDSRRAGELGWDPRVSLHEGMRQVLSAHQLTTERTIE